MKTYVILKKIVGIIFILFIGKFCAQAQLLTENKPADKELSFPKSSQFSKTKLTYKIINATNKTWCYDIYADGRLIIHQYSIPAMPGNEGFKTKGAAEKVAKLVIEKIKKGEMPPTITVEEMKKLKVI